MKTTEIGAVGETLAAEFLRSKGYRILERNLHIGHLELDIICENETHLLFVEVKARTDRGVYHYGRPANAVNATKKKHLLDAVYAYLREHPTAKQPRLDIIEVNLWRKGSYITLSPRGICHIENILT